MGVLIASIVGAVGIGLALWKAWHSGALGGRVDAWACSKLERLRTLPRDVGGIEIDEREIPLARRAREVGYPLRIVTGNNSGAVLTLDGSRQAESNISGHQVA